MINQWKWAEILFLIQILSLLTFALQRLPHRKKNPPPSFLLMGFGFVHAIIGASFLLISRFGEQHFFLYSIGRQMIQLGFLLCAVLGVTARLTPFLMGYGNDPRLDLQDRSAPMDKKLLIIHGSTGGLILASFFVEPVNQATGWAMRAIVSTIHFLVYAKIARPIRQPSAFINFFVLSCWSIVTGLWAGLVAPTYKIASLHIVFIGGFSLMIFSFALNVVYSHSSQPEKLFGRLIKMRVIGMCILLALIFRVLADVWSEKYFLFIHIASGTWVLIALFWLIVLFPRFFDKPVSHR